MPKTIAIGAIRTSFGLAGWLKVASYSGEWRHFEYLKRVCLTNARGEGSTEYAVDGFRKHHGSGILKLRGIDTPESAKAFAQCQILIDENLGTSLGENEWYIRDLIGLSVINTHGQQLGVVLSVIESADDLLEIRRTDKTVCIVPFRRQFVSEPDMEHKTIVLTAEWIMENL